MPMRGCDHEHQVGARPLQDLPVIARHLLDLELEASRAGALEIRAGEPDQPDPLDMAQAWQHGRAGETIAEEGNTDGIGAR
jgi:hypothetical protein